MTIAACYLSSEGVVFGADSTTTMRGRFFNHGQKIYPIGENTYLGMVSWGVGGLGDTSYRTLIARLGDTLRGRPPQPLEKVAEEWIGLFWPLYQSVYGEGIAKLKALEAKQNRTEDENKELLDLKSGLTGGFCIGGYCALDRLPKAIEITFDPMMTTCASKELAIGDVEFWGNPTLVDRLIVGFDWRVLDAFFDSGKWTGTQDELADIFSRFKIVQPVNVPLREAIDWVHAAIYMTIKATKFSNEDPSCGGAVEIAAIPTDSRFRWVLHKTLGSAIFHDRLQEYSDGQ